MTLSLARVTIEQVLLAVFVGAAVSGFASSQATLPAWLLLLPCASALFCRVDRVPQAGIRGLQYGVWALVSGTLVLGLLLMAYPVLLGQSVPALELIAGYSLAASSALFLLGSSVWPVASTLFPAALGTMAVAAFNPKAQMRGPLIVASLAVVAHLFLTCRVEGAREASARGAVRRLTGAALSALVTALLAWGIIRLLPWAQSQLEQATFRFYSGRSESRPARFERTFVASRLGQLRQLKLSRRVVLRVWASRPQKLRGFVSAKFDGQVWQAWIVPGQFLPTAPGEPPLDKGLVGWLSSIPGQTYVLPGKGVDLASNASMVRTEVVRVAEGELAVLVAPGDKWLVRSSAPQLRVDAYETLFAPVPPSPGQAYGVVNRSDGGVAQAGVPPSSMVAECLAVPADTDPRLRELAAQFGKGARSAEERIERTVRFLQSTCQYSLDVGSFHSRQPVAEFVFEKKKGYCEYFASAAALLLRLQGVPTRYVTGYNVGEGNRQGDHYVVRGLDAHAWVEAYVARQPTGWLEVDPTPEAEYLSLHANLQEGWWDSFSEWVGAKWGQARMWWRPRDWLAALGRLWRPGVSLLFVSLLALLVGYRRRRARREARKGIPLSSGVAADPAVRELAGIMEGLDRLWGHAGYKRPAWRAPLEHLASIPPQALPPDQLEISRRTVECFYRCVFGGVPCGEEELRELKRGLENPPSAAG